MVRRRKVPKVVSYQLYAKKSDGSLTLIDAYHHRYSDKRRWR